MEAGYKGFPSSFAPVLALLARLRDDEEAAHMKIEFERMLDTRPREERIDDSQWVGRFAELRLRGALTVVMTYIDRGTAAGCPGSVLEMLRRVRGEIDEALVTARSGGKAPWAAAIDDAVEGAARRQVASANAPEPPPFSLDDI